MNARLLHTKNVSEPGAPEQRGKHPHEKNYLGATPPSLKYTNINSPYHFYVEMLNIETKLQTIWTNGFKNLLK